MNDAPNYCDACAMDSRTCDCVNPRHSFVPDSREAATADKIAQLQAEVERLSKDAARYRFLRAGILPNAKSILNDSPQGIDAAIDAAMQESQP